MKKKLKLWVGDLETITPKTEYFKKNNDTGAYLGGYVGLEDDETNIKIFKSIGEFIEMLKQEYTSGICYFHNLNFDGDFIYKYFISKNIACLDNHKLRKVGYHVRFVESQIYEIIYNFTSKTNGKVFFHKIYFKCSWRLLSNNLESIGKNYGIEKKLESDEDDFYDNEPDAILSDRFIQYLKNDIIILKRALHDFMIGLNSIKNIDKMKRWYNVLTIGSLSYAIQKKYVYNFSKEKLGNKEIYKGLRITSEEIKLANNFYYGGWTHFNQNIQYQNYKCKNIGLAIDINSAHPSSMKKLLPFGKIYKKEEFKKISDHKLKYLHLKIEKATCKYLETLTLKNWKSKIKDTDLNINGRYCVELNKFECYYLEEEFELLKNFYDFKGVKVIQEYWCNAEYFLKEYIDDLYKLKVDNAKNSFGQTYKILLNSGYGKHAQRKDYDAFIMINKKDWKNEKEYILNEKIYNVNSVEPLLEGEIDDMLILTLSKEKLNTTGANKLIAATICSYTRILLWNEILFYGAENFLYGDTDSLRLDITKEKLDASMKRFNDTAIGKFSIEDIFTSIEVSGAKRYRLLDENNKTIKYAFSGLNKKYLKKKLNNDKEIFTRPEHLYLDGKISMKRCKSGSILFETDLKTNRLKI